jgi:hypothetical protein
MNDHQWRSGPRVTEWLRLMICFSLRRELADPVRYLLHSAAQPPVQVLKQCGDDLAAENAIRQAASLGDVRPPVASRNRLTPVPMTMRFLRNRGSRALMANNWMSSESAAER